MASQAPSIPRVGVIGSGSWATALTFLFTQHEEAATHPVHWWIRQPESLEHIRKTGHNPHYLQSLTLDRDRLAFHGDVQAVVDASDLVVLCVPSAYLDDALQGVTGLDGKVVFNAIKGFITDDHHIPARYLHKVFRVPYDRIGLISGPSHAEEVARKNWTYLTLACPDVPLAEAVADRVRNPWLRTETTDDLFGIELAAVLKNVYAVAAGIAHGLGLGDNFIAVMMANALQETRRFLDAVNETSRDVNASAYMGDLIVTA
ncbi:MAG: NAD(P)-binding domain-containing protein [Bacteroidota bacterium]|nr:NAD(P)-binding domain-containing protein [Bacteroidota bacterium]